MSYRHIENLYKNKDILLFKECVASEKIHGSSSWITYSAQENKLSFFAGGCKHESFLAIFDQEKLLEIFRSNATDHPHVEKIIVFGEVYGGKMQGMSHIYGPDLKFIAFEVRINDEWMGPLQAEKLATRFGFPFVPYNIIPTTEEAINAEMMADSVVAVRYGMGPGHMREGIVLRPLVELIHPNGGRIISKHKRPEFAERVNTPRFSDPAKLALLANANEIAEEWVVMERLRHVLDTFSEPKMEDANKVIKAMVEDVLREAVGEIVDDKAVRKAIGKQTIKLFKAFLYSSK